MDIITKTIETIMDLIMQGDDFARLYQEWKSMNHQGL